MIEKTKKMTQTIISNNLRMTEITKLNVEASNLMREKEKLLCKIGKYVIEQGCLKENETITELIKEFEEKNAGIEEKQKRVREIRGINFCSVCGIEVGKDKEFCPKCGMELKQAVRQNGSIY